MNDNMEAVSTRIRALLAKTVENGATEAEAMSAAAKAREWMDKYRLSMSDVEIQAEPLVQEQVDRPNETRIAAVDYCLGGIDRYCGVKTWYTTTAFTNGSRYRAIGIKKLSILGLKADVEMARYLYTMIGGAIKSELARWQKARGERDRAATSSFQVGMASRINSRLTDMARALEPVAMTGSGTALIVVKNAIVEDAYREISAGFSKSTSSGMSSRDGAAYRAGAAAGDRVNLSRPLRGGTILLAK